LQDPLAGPIVRHQVGHRVALGRGVLRVGADIQIEPGAVAQEDVAGPTPGDDPAEQVPGYLIRRQPPLAAVRAGDSVLGLKPEDAPVHEQTLAAASLTSSLGGAAIRCSPGTLCNPAAARRRAPAPAKGRRRPARTATAAPPAIRWPVPGRAGRPCAPG